jgi:hypothetical protein
MSDEIQQLIAQRTAAVPSYRAWEDYEIQAISGASYLDYELATHALGFTAEKFGSCFTQAVSCDICGAMFTEHMPAMRRHRLQCGWEA